jgi:hypothetical protein
MDIADLIGRLSLYNNPHTNKIIQQINQVAQLGYNSLVYDFDTNDSDSVLEVCNKIKQEFPEISIQVLETSILFDWS